MEEFDIGFDEGWMRAQAHYTVALTKAQEDIYALENHADTWKDKFEQCDDDRANAYKRIQELEESLAGLAEERNKLRAENYKLKKKYDV